MITREAQRVLHGNLAFLKGVRKEYDAEFAKNGAKIGDTLRVRLPNKYTVRTGRVMDVQATTNRKVSLPVTTQKGVDISFTNADRTLSLDDYSQNVLKPAMSVLAADLDYTALAMSLDVANSVGTPGTAPASAQVWLDAAAMLDTNLAPRDGDRMALATPKAMARTVDGLKGLIEAGDAIADQYRNGIMTRALGFRWAMDQNMRNITTGTNTNRTTTCDLAANVAEGDATLSIDGLSGATVTITAGEVFTIAGVYAVNDETKQSTNELKQFVVTSSKTGSGSAITNLPIAPAIYAASGGLQNVTALPVSGDDLVFYGTTAATVYPQNLAFHKDAFMFASADLALPRSGEASRKVMDGVSMRIWQGDDITNDMDLCRVDVLFGYATIYPELGCRVWG